MSDQDIELLKLAYAEARKAWEETKIALLQAKSALVAAKKNRADADAALVEWLAKEPARNSIVRAGKYGEAVKALETVERLLQSAEERERLAGKAEQVALVSLTNVLPA